MEDPGSSSLKKLKRVSSAGKVMASVYSDNQGIIMEYYLEEGHIINCACYAEELRQLYQDCEEKKRKVGSRCSALARTFQVAMAAVTKCNFEVLPHPLYSLGLAPSDFNLFSNLRGRSFEAMKVSHMRLMNTWGGKEEGFYLEGISKLDQSWRKSIEAKGDYIENNGTMSALGHSQRTGAENFFNCPSYIE